MNTDKLMELLAKATPGPWEIVPGDEWTTDVGTPEGEYEDGRKRHWNVLSVNRRRDEWETNRALIVAAVNALPELLDELDRLRKDAERYRWLRDRMFMSDAIQMVDRNFEHGPIEESTYSASIDVRIDAAIAAQEGRE